MECPRFREFMSEQIKLIQRHYEKHAYFRHIPDHEQAKLEFIKEFGGIIREAYCSSCEEHPGCEVYRKYILANRE